MTKANCKPGDLAITVTCFNLENLGRIVEVLRVAEAKPCGKPQLKDETGLIWWVRAAGGHLLYRKGDEEWTQDEGPAPDRCLRPLPPPPAEMSMDIAVAVMAALDAQVPIESEVV